jgi:hypothetical protein
MTVRCPYCAEEIAEQALVCKHCGQNLHIAKPFMDVAAALRAEIAELRAVVAELKGSAPSESAQVGGQTSVATGLRSAGFYLIAYIIVPVLLLIGAHYVIVMRLNLNTIVLRLTSMAIPLPFGVLLRTAAGHGLGAAFVVGTVVAVLAVTGMLAVVGTLDNVPIIPANRREWQESIEYGLSITLSIVTGNLLGRLIKRYSAPRARAGSASAEDDSPMARMFRWDMIVTGLGAIATAIMSAISGLKGE